MPLHVWRHCVRLKSIGLHARERVSRRIYFHTYADQGRGSGDCLKARVVATPEFKIIMELSEYSLEPLRDDQEFVLYRGHPREAKGSSVLMLAPLSIRPAPETLKKIKHECSFANDLD